jgi:hypothetical protein
MRKRKTTETKDECMAKINGSSQREKAIELLSTIQKKKKNTIFVSSKLLFPFRKELLIEVDAKSTKEQRNEIITRRMTAKSIE